MADENTKSSLRYLANECREVLIYTGKKTLDSDMIHIVLMRMNTTRSSNITSKKMNDSAIIAYFSRCLGSGYRITSLAKRDIINYASRY